MGKDGKWKERWLVTVRVVHAHVKASVGDGYVWPLRWDCLDF